MSTTHNLQIKLSLDKGLKNVWDFLTEEYEGLDKSGIVRLALNNLAKSTKRQHAEKVEFDMKKFFDELDQSTEGPTENEFAKWWNENKHNLR